jgi:hypothetical protein
MPQSSHKKPSLASLPIEMRSLIMRKINSDTLRSLHHAQTGTRSKLTTLTNAKLHLSARNKLTAKVEEIYRVRLRRAFATAIGALEYEINKFRPDETANEKLIAQGWEKVVGVYRDYMTKTNKDGFVFKLEQGYFSIHNFVMRCKVMSPLGSEWTLEKARPSEQNKRIKYSYPFQYYHPSTNIFVWPNNRSNSARKRRIEVRVANKVLQDEFKMRYVVQ